MGHRHCERTFNSSIQSGFFVSPAVKIVASGIFCFLCFTLATAGQIGLSWTDNSLNEDGFEIERAIVGESFSLVATVGTDEETFQDESVLPGLAYEYRVRAFNSFGFSGYTNVAQGLLPNTAPVVGEVADITIFKGEAIPSVEFSIFDAESGESELVVEAMSSNLDLLPLENISMNLGAGTGTLSMVPNGSAIGSSEVTLFVSDGVAIVQKTFNLAVLRNLAPTIGSIGSLSVYDGQVVGPVAFSVADSEYDASQLAVSALSMDESMIDSSSIAFSGSGANRSLYFKTKEGASGATTIRVSVSDGVNTTNGAFNVSVTVDEAPTIDGLGDSFTIEDGGKLGSLSFTVADKETSASNLDVSVISSNSLMISPVGMRLQGSGSQRTLELSSNPGYPGFVTITVLVSDGIKTTRHAMSVQVLAPEQVVKVIGFSIEEGLAVIEVENRPGATFTLWKIHSRDGAWARVEDVEAIVGLENTVLVDPTPVDAAVCYRVIASQ